MVKCEENEAPHNTILGFGLKLVTVCFNKKSVNPNDTVEKRLITSGLLTRLINTIDKKNNLQTVSVRLSLILFLRRVSTCPIGLQYIKETAVWIKVINYKEGDQSTIYIVRETSAFVHDILRGYDAVGDEVTCMKVLEDLLAPLLNSIWIGPDYAIHLDNSSIKQIIFKMLSLLEQFFYKILEHEELFYIPYYLFIKIGIENKLWKLRDISLTEEFSTHMIKVITIANYTRFTCLKIPPQDTTSQLLKLDKFCVNFYNFTHFGVMRNSANIILMITEVNNLLWYKLGPRRPTEELIPNQNLKFGDQTLMIQLTPLLYVLKDRHHNDDYIEDFCQDLYSVTCEQTIRHLYSMREVLRQNKKSITDLACSSLQGLALSGPLMCRERAIIVFKALIVAIIEFLPMDYDLLRGYSYLEFDNPNLLLTILMSLNALIQNYNITTADKPDSNLFKIVLYLLGVSGLSVKVNFKTLLLKVNLCWR